MRQPRQGQFAEESALVADGAHLEPRARHVRLRLHRGVRRKAAGTEEEESEVRECGLSEREIEERGEAQDNAVRGNAQGPTRRTILMQEHEGEPARDERHQERGERGQDGEVRRDVSASRA